MLNKLHVENFTVFRKADFEFVPGINVLVGANASGKTHLLKLLYSLQKAQTTSALQGRRRDAVDVMLSVFRPESLNALVRRDAPLGRAAVTALWNGKSHEFGIETSPVGGHAIHDFEGWQDVPVPVFVPVKDMLAHSVGFISLYDQRNIDFDETYRDILSLAFTPALRPKAREAAEPLLDLIAERIEGRVDVQGDRFYLDGPGGRFEMHLVAEGWRKLALLSLLSIR